GHHDFHRDGLKISTTTLVKSCFNRLVEQIGRALSYYCKLANCSQKNCPARAIEIAYLLLDSLPSIRESLKLDVEAAMEGDPAATSQDEIIISYPGLKAIAIYRIANILYQQKVPLIPRVMSEHAHHETGIDIHPGATIGQGLFIDHGTGVVIGETAILGKKVKIYQGVTLGALSFPKDENGYAIRGQKRHPSIADNVTIYAGATILGDILIGQNSVIGGNVWLMDNILPNTLVTIDKPALTIKTRK
ncbi:MAG: serine O-acetyltransferase EpsC, partial [Lentisphaeria bacterium]